MPLISIWRRIGHADLPGPAVCNLERETYANGFQRRPNCGFVARQNVTAFLERVDRPRGHAGGASKLLPGPSEQFACFAALIWRHCQSKARFAG